MLGGKFYKQQNMQKMFERILILMKIASARQKPEILWFGREANGRNFAAIKVNGGYFFLSEVRTFASHDLGLATFDSFALLVSVILILRVKEATFVLSNKRIFNASTQTLWFGSKKFSRIISHRQKFLLQNLILKI